MRNLRQAPMTDHQSQWNDPQQPETSRKPIRNLTEFLELVEAEHVRQGVESSPITVETETMDSSGTMRYGVILNPRRPRPRNDNQKEI